MNRNINLKPYNILIVGDIMLDRYLTGNIERISPEAPVPILEKVKIDNKPGGAANVALNIKSLGSNPILVSIVGDDKNGISLTQILEKDGISTSNILVDKTRQTTVKTRIMSEGQHILRIDEEDTSYLDENNKEKLLNSIKQVINKSNIDALILQDYDKGLLNNDIIESIIKIAKQKSIFISVDPKFDNFYSYKNVDLFKPNLKEVSSALNKTVTSNIKNLDEVSEELKDKLQFKHLYITLGSKGVYYSDGVLSEITPTKLKSVVDVSGAGDVVLSVSTLFFLERFSPKEVACFSNIAGGLACGKVGVATVKKKVLIEEIEKSQI